MLLLANLANRRQLELTNPQQREHILVGLTTLKKSIHMLKTAMTTFVKYPDNPQAKVRTESFNTYYDELYFLVLERIR